MRLVSIVIVICVAVALPGAAAIPSEERQALLDLYDSAGGAGWVSSSAWQGAAGTECSWYGVTCDGALAHVQHLVLSNNDLRGTLPTTIGQLGSLLTLDLGSNSGLYGALPSQLGDLALIEQLDLGSGAHFSGPIPAELGGLSNLAVLNLGEADLIGEIPPELGNLTNLTVLNLEHNRLSGPVPAALGSLSGLQNLYLNSNRLAGELPTELLSLTALGVGGSDVRWNSLYTDNATLRSFLDSKQTGGDWTYAQTRAPASVSVSRLTGVSAAVEWTGFACAKPDCLFEFHTSGGGQIQVSTLSPVSSGPWVVFDLEPSTSYSVQVRTITQSHSANKNSVESELSAAIVFSTTSDASTVYVAPGGLPTNDCRTPATPCGTIQDGYLKAVDGEQILVAAGTYGGASIYRDLHIKGAGAGLTIIDHDCPGFRIASLPFVKISGLTVQNCWHPMSGGGMRAAGAATLHLVDSVIRNNSTETDGGGLVIDGATLENVEISGNSAVGKGGGIYTDAGFWMKDCTVSDNQADVGGGIHIYSYGHVTIEASTITGNSASTNSGGINAEETSLFMSNTTVSGNTASAWGAGGLFFYSFAPDNLWLNSCTVVDNIGGASNGSGVDIWGSNNRVFNTVIANNSPVNCGNGAVSIGHNLEDGTSCEFDQGGDLINTDPLLGTLADNGGPTWTHAPLAGSPLIDGGPWCDRPATDQRGSPRPLDGDGDGLLAADIGAFENATSPLFADGFESGTTSAWHAAVP